MSLNDDIRHDRLIISGIVVALTLLSLAASILLWP